MTKQFEPQAEVPMCRNSNGKCDHCTPSYCSSWLGRPPCYDTKRMNAAIRHEQERLITLGLRKK